MTSDNSSGSSARIMVIPYWDYSCSK